MERTKVAYFEQNHDAIKACYDILENIGQGAKKDYRFGWAPWEAEYLQEEQNEENELAQRERRQPFEIVHQMSLLELSMELDLELKRLGQILLDQVEKTEKPQPSPAADPYENPFAHTSNYYDAQARTAPQGRVEPNEPLRTYTEFAGFEAMNKLDQLITFNGKLLAWVADLRVGFFWFHDRPGPLQKKSIIGLLFDFMDSIEGRGDLEDDERRRTRWTNGEEEFIDTLYSIPDDPNHTDRSDDPDDLDFENEYVPYLPFRTEYLKNGKELFLLGLNGLLSHLGPLAQEYQKLIIKTFKPPLMKNHPEVSAAWDLAYRQYQFMMFYYEGLSRFSFKLSKLPDLTTTWVEPTKQQIKYMERKELFDGLGEYGEDITEDYFANFGHLDGAVSEKEGSKVSIEESNSVNDDSIVPDYA
ncbi:hypothetical protein H072_2943 [Dactylellina haptotyla CBS 200.50]|uniref:Uncharacterized protein n=1 Tax=Dactylellina haptotyla (strain CBS 200.50) TaxID=1284197 RepID=S8C5T7_DACHA|nr:hypothetical protein H072_2943 [Dactylellina haptotyla CBS 200.50]